MKSIVTILAVWLVAVCFAVCDSSLAAADEARRLQVFILAGQSNMQGHGIIASVAKRNEGRGSLEYLVKNAATAADYRHLVDADGAWKARSDVAVTYGERRGMLAPGFGADADRIGPELGFGTVVGDAYDEPVLLIKCAWGGKSLAVDFRPPSAGPVPHKLSAGEQAAIEKDPQVVGKYYREILSITRGVLADLKTHYPTYDGRGYELVGFGWHQGWNDRINDAFNAEYESNMAHLIRDLRRDLQTAKLPVVIAETGMSGPDEAHPRALSLMKAQAAVAEHAEFKGNVAFVKTQSFWRPQTESPSAQGYHWNQNAETYYLIGKGMGQAMLTLDGKKD
ncbi:MAG: sialate O-acetylesterase [Planctomycetia bacterium]|nr:sialate O-acetylesterase [Planctomycetia bacterium]